MVEPFAANVAPVVYPATHPAREWRGQAVKSTESLFQQACPKQHKRSQKIIRSAFDSIEDQSATISASGNGLVYGIFKAYSDHHHLVIRPEDVWFAILTQLSFHINANAEELRSLFVPHEGQKEVKVNDVGNINTVDIGALAVALTHEMEKHIVDADLREWIVPDFTTTTWTDTVTAAVLMMGSMQKYFSYTMQIECGIPSVQLLGDREDWVSIRGRLDKLTSFGKEPELFGRLLMPVLDNFVRTFDQPANDKVKDFWNKICHHESMGSGPDYLSGWVTAFCFWDEDGKPMSFRSRLEDALPLYDKDASFDSQIYHEVDTEDIPAGIVSVPVKVDDNGTVYNTTMVAGSVGMQWTVSGEALDVSNTHNDPNLRRYMDGNFVPSVVEVQQGYKTGLDTLQPVTGWWMYWLKDEEELKRMEEQERKEDEGFG